MCLFQVWRARNTCPGSACFSAILRLTCTSVSLCVCVCVCLCVEHKECLSQQCMLLCYIEVDLVSVSDVEDKDACPSTVHLLYYTEVVDLCVWCLCGGQRMPVPVVHVTVHCAILRFTCVFQPQRTRNACPSSECYCSIRRLTMCPFQVRRTKSACPSNACYCAILRSTCVSVSGAENRECLPQQCMSLCYTEVDLYTYFRHGRRGVFTVTVLF